MPLSAPSLLLWLMTTTSLTRLTHGSVFTTQQEQDVVHFVDSLRQCRGVTGLTMAVVKGNHSWTRGFGKADRDTGEQVSSSHLLGIGSVTKTFTSALLAILLDQNNRYSWDTPVRDILGAEFELVNDQLTRQVTLQDMLTHNTGLDTATLPILAGSNMTAAKFAQRLRYLPAKKQFREEFDYNNWMYGLLGRVTEVLGGDRWENLLRDLLLRPLGMSSTGVTGKTVSMQTNTFAKPYVKLGGRTVLSDSDIYSLNPWDASGAVASTADDMVQWLLLHVNEGWSERGGQVINTTLWRQMTSAHVQLSAGFAALYSLLSPPFPVNFSTEGYGYGWLTATYRGYPVVWHAGHLHAYTGFLAFLPDHNVGVFLANNGPHESSRMYLRVLHYVVDLLLNEEDPWLNISTACRFPAHWRNNTSSVKQTTSVTVYNDPHFPEPGNLAGRYGHPLFGEVHVATKIGSDGLTVQYGHLEGRLFRGGDQDQDHVAMAEVQGKLEFLFRPQNHTTYVQLRFSNSSSAESVFHNVKLIAGRQELEFVREVASGGGSG